MYFSFRTINVALLSFAIFAPIGVAGAADLPPLPVKAKPITDVPFFLVNDNRVTYSYIFDATEPGQFSRRSDGSIDGKTTKSVYSFTHFDAWAYGTNFFSISMYKSGQNNPAAPCSNAGILFSGVAENCAGATEIYDLIRSTFGSNEVFETKAFSIGPLRNISFEIGADANTENTFLTPAKRDLVAGLQFAFDLPYKRFFNVAPLYYKEINHNAFSQCGLFGPGVPSVTCLADGNTDFQGTWTVETNYYMDLGFLPETINYFSISGRAAWYGPKGTDKSPLPFNAVSNVQRVVEFNSEPIRLTFDASRAIWGPKYSHNVDLGWPIAVGRTSLDCTITTVRSATSRLG
jgi:hypothetical protein